MKQTNNLLKIYSTLPELQIERQPVECRGNLSSAGCAVIYIATDADCLPFGRIQRLAGSTLVILLSLLMWVNGVYTLRTWEVRVAVSTLRRYWRSYSICRIQSCHCYEVISSFVLMS